MISHGQHHHHQQLQQPQQQHKTDLPLHHGHDRQHGNTSLCVQRRSTSRRRRLLHWNILDGGADRLPGIKRFLRSGEYDVVTFNELNGFDATSLAALGQAVGLVHTHLLSKSRYHMGILSRHPLTGLAHERGHEFAHGVLCAHVLNVALCVTHLNPHDVHRRAIEARLIVRHHAMPAIRAGTPFVLVGDLNTLSSLDRPDHDAAALPSTIRKGPFRKALGKKFLSHSGATVDYTPMQVLLDAPLTDLGAGSGYTVPTSINADRMHFAKLRLDYCLASHALLAAKADTATPAGCEDGIATSHPLPLEDVRRKQRTSASAHVVRSAATNTLSDHFPLVCEWDDEDP